MKIQFLSKLSAIIFTFIFSIGHAQWTPVNVGTTNNVYAVDYLDASNIFMVGDDGFIKSTNGGLSWTTYPLLDNFSNPIVASWFYDIHFFDPSNGVATGFITTGNSEAVYRTSNGGLNWTLVNLNNVGNWPRMMNDIGFSSATGGIACGTNGRIIRTTNSGTSWTNITSGVLNNLTGVSFGSTSLGIIVGDQVILRTANGGASWSVVSTPTNNLKNVHMLNTTLGFAVGTNGVLKTINGGFTWNQINTLSSEDIYIVDSDSAFICNSGVFKTANIGGFWGAQASVSAGTYNDLDFLNLTNGFVVGNNGKVYRTTTGGEPVPQTDASVFLVDPISPNLCPGSIPVKVKLKNYGINTISTVTVNWSVNNVYQGSYAWTGILQSDSISPLVTIGNYNFNFSSQKIKAWVSNPNNTTDQFIGNDSASTVFQTQRLSGNYKIGGVSPDFLTFSDASTAINNFGICGNVIFDVRNGVYTESISIGNYPTSSSSYSITFRSEVLDSSLVTLNSPTFTAVQLNNAKNISFQKLSVSSGSYSAIEYRNGSDGGSVKNCIIKGALTGTNACISYSGTTSHSIIIENNAIQNGNYGVYLSGSSSNYAREIKVNNNIFTGQLSKCIYILYSDSAVMNKNIITSTVTSGFEGINFTNSKGAFKIMWNKIFTDVGTGISVVSCTNTGTNYGKVHNNFIRTGLSSTAGTAFKMTACFQMEVANNTFHVLGTSGINTALLIGCSDTVAVVRHRVFNNLLTASGGGCPVYITNSANTSKSYYYNKLFDRIGPNCYYNTAVNFMQLPTSTPTSLIDWKNTVIADSFSIVRNPQFVSINDLHIYPNSSNYGLESAGIPWTGITNDIDNQPRTGNPDIGADEFLRPSLDLHLYSMSDTTKICTGNSPMLFRVINRGSSLINSFILNWSVNSILQTPFNWTGTLLPGDTTAYFTSGSYSYSPGNYNIKASVSSPNTGTDMIAANDSIKKTLSAGGLNGNYTIGATASTYSTITAAVSDLISQGVCGPVVFDIKSGTYNEQVTISVIAGSSPYNTITFRSLSGDSTTVIWNYLATSANNFVLKLNGTDNLRIERITLQSLSSTYNTALDAQLGCDNLRIVGCRFLGKPNASGKMVNFSGALDNNIVIDGNYFYSGLQAIYMTATFPTWESNNRITNNYFFNTRHRCIEVDNQLSLTIDDNLILCDTVCIGQSFAISAGSKFASSVSNNIVNVQMEYGITWSQNSGWYSVGKFHNNMVRNRGSQAYRAITVNGALWLAGGGGVNNVFHNSARLENTSMPNNVCASFSNGTPRIFNNIFSTVGTTGSTFDSDFSNTALYSNNNVFEGSGTVLIRAMSTNFATLSAWKSFSGKDMNSLQGNPGFVSSSDFHISPTSIANNTGTTLTLPYVNNDLDGDIRMVFPDIGADERRTAPSVFLGNDTTFCVGHILNAGTSGSSFLWNTSATTQTISVSNSGMYWVNVTNSLGSSTDTINLTIVPNPTVSINSASVCPGYSTNLTANGASTYTWNTSANSNSITVSPTVTTTYSVVGTATNGCQAVSNTTVTVYSLPSITITPSPNPICAGQTSTLTASGASTYTWNTSVISSSIIISPTTTTSYSLTGTSLTGCDNTKSVSITVNPVPTLTIAGNYTTICTGQTASITAQGAWTYTWNPGNVNWWAIIISPTVTTVYSVVATSSLGCDASGSYTLNVSPCTSITEMTNSVNCSVFPNPNTGNLFVRKEHSAGQNVFYEVRDAIGKLLIRNKLETNSNKSDSSIDISGLTNGMYFFYIYTEGEQPMVFKIIKE